MNRFRPGILALVAVGLVGIIVAVVAVVRFLQEPPTAASDNGLRLRATVEQWRTDEVARTVEVALRNDGAQPVWVTRIELVLPSFAGAGSTERSALLPPGGQRVDVPVSYGSGRCDGAAEPAGGPPTSEPSAVVVEAHAEGAPSTRLRLPLPHPNALLDKLLHVDCQQERLRRVASIGFAGWRTAPDGTLHGAVLVTRTGEDVPVVLHDVAGSVTLAIRPVPVDRARPLGALAPGRRVLEVPVSADAARCDPHAVAEVKKPYEFRAWASIGDIRLATTVAVGDADRAALDRMFRRRCKLPD